MRSPPFLPRPTPRPALRFAFALCAALLLACPEARAFAWPDLVRRAEALAAAAYVKPPERLPKELRELDYEAYRDIRYKPERAHWRREKLPFELTFFHQGRDYAQAVAINELVGGQARAIPYRPEDFDFGANTTRIASAQLKNLGFAGFRVHYALNTPRIKDEVIVFLGASYFRALGKGQAYGLSARALAVDTAEAPGEEFPRFVEFWIERPEAGARQIVIYALLDSPRVAGAYRFLVRPGVETQVDVTARIYLRAAVAKLGIAPLTSMYYFGENQPAESEDYRPEVHDSDGLSISVGNGEAIWRPLVNPKRLLVTSFAISAQPGAGFGFGLQQRDRHFASYEDLATRYEARPSTWIAPQGNWGEGRVELVQIPTPDETNDNIVAYWVPAMLPRPRRPLDFAYRLSWQKDREHRPPLFWVAQTRRGPGYTQKKDGNIFFLVDFVGGLPAGSTPAGAPEPEAAIELDANSQLVSSRIERNPASGGYRLFLVVRRLAATKPIDMRAWLRRADTRISETWSYILPAD